MIRGVRGAITVDCNSEEAILSATEQLLRQIIEGNNILPDQVASVFISTTDDLNAAFPAKAMRKFAGWTFVPVICMRELSVPNSLQMCVRVMLHVNTAVPQEEVVHVYLEGATVLRPDLGNSVAK
ncbi:chorismate mutase [Neobacillus sp. DY30]|uniref:chorismate mutase n=1 Tax=Neobacillus sp. DY30 TaxID=3047871 RepID=UPI0024BFF8E2|nr:chorismate mutase [Neobacillus sp. DY30]WHX99094.1 chorismate mutase [Neobacillus sp. DY30]